MVGSGRDMAKRYHPPALTGRGKESGGAGYAGTASYGKGSGRYG
jgi:hypothetical protein